MTQDEQQKLERMRHSFAHVLAQAVLRIYPGSKLGIGPVIEHGFYYDIETPQAIDHSVLPQIEAEMKNIIEEGLPFKQIIIPREQAFDTLHHMGQIYKTELLQQIPDETISFFKTGEEFIDLCRGPHIDDTSKLRFFKLTKIEDVNWLGDPNRPNMYRIIGVAFKDEDELQNHLYDQETKKQRDHKLLGKQLQIYSEDKNTPLGMPTLLNNGVKIKDRLISKVKSRFEQNDHELLSTSSIIRESVLHTTRTLDYTREIQLPQIQLGSHMHRLRNNSINQIFLQFNNKKRSYKDMPLIFSELGEYFMEVSNPQGGLFATKAYTGDYSISFVQPEKTIPEVKRLIEELSGFIKSMGLLNYKIVIGTQSYDGSNQHYIGNEQDWKDAEYIIDKALSEAKLIGRKHPGEAKYNGPSISFRLRDVSDQEWEIAVITLDLALPKIANLKFVTTDSEEETPIAIHFSYISSIERLIGIIIEEYGGEFPVWLSPEQVRIIPISSKHITYAKSVLAQIELAGIRSKLDKRDETMQLKIRDAQIDKVPYMIILGDKETQTTSVSVRPRDGQDLGLMRVDEFAAHLLKEIQDEKN